MTEKSPQLLTAVPEESTPDGVGMWNLEPGAALPSDCPASSAWFVVQPGAATEVDVHDVVEVWTVISGEGVVLSGGRRTPLVTGQSIFFPSRLDHQLVNESAAPVTLFSIWWLRAEP